MMQTRIAGVRSAAVAPLPGRAGKPQRRVVLILGYHNQSLLGGIFNYAREANWTVDDSHVRFGRPPLLTHGDGILAMITHRCDLAALNRLDKMPMVDLSEGWLKDGEMARLGRKRRQCPRVVYDNGMIGELAAHHFLERGFRHAAFLNCGNFWNETERIGRFRKVLAAGGCQYHGIPLHQHARPQRLGGTFEDMQRGRQWLASFLRQLPKPLAIATRADDDALLALDACDLAGLSVPEEVAVLGGDNDPLICDYARVPLSSIDFNWERIGYEGARLLDGLMDGGEMSAEALVIPPKGVVTRLSTNVLAVPNVRVARAIRFIWEHYREDIGTDQVATAAGISRRSLEREFKRHFGLTVAHEIAHVRVDRAKQLLLETPLKGHVIAEQCGFPDVYRFSKVFHRLTGVRPGAFRREHRHPPSVQPENRY